MQQPETSPANQNSERLPRTEISRPEVQIALMHIAYKKDNPEADLSTLEDNDIAMPWMERNAGLYRDYVDAHDDEEVDVNDETALKDLYSKIVEFGNEEAGETKH